MENYITMNMPDKGVLTVKRVERVVKVPSWANDYVKVGDLVFRETGGVHVIDNHMNINLGKSYTKYVEHRLCV
jgi:hypothetical protein